ncbi:MAG: CheR family methyltransferase [Planctomycetota bacterium]
MGLDRLTSEQFELFRQFIYQSSGIHVDERKVTLLSNRIRGRLRAGEFEDFDSYYRFLTSPAGGNELAEFLNVITTNETFFFRNSKQLDWLASDWVDQQLALHRAGKRDDQLHILSAGCASGAEAYSIAICLAENLYRLRGWSLKVTGVDISEEMLQVAREAVFRPRVMEGVSDRQRKRFFLHQRQEDLWKVRPSIQEMVRFSRHNLMEPLKVGRCDCIFIRNVLIYFDSASKQTVVKHLIQALKPGGYLVVGPSEGIY